MHKPETVRCTVNYRPAMCPVAVRKGRRVALKPAGDGKVYVRHLTYTKTYTTEQFPDIVTKREVNEFVARVHEGYMVHFGHGPTVQAAIKNLVENLEQMGRWFIKVDREHCWTGGVAGPCLWLPPALTWFERFSNWVAEKLNNPK